MGVGVGVGGGRGGVGMRVVRGSGRERKGGWRWWRGCFENLREVSWGWGWVGMGWDGIL